jgi:ribonuclease III
MMANNALAELQSILGVRFREPDLLLEALTHRSYLNEHDSTVRDNERLEFLGDSVMDFLVTNRLFMRYPESSEGQLTELRAALVRAESFFALARVWQLERFLRTGKNEIKSLTSDGKVAVMLLSRAFEAVIGAIYLDQGWSVVEDVVGPLIEERLAYILERSLHEKDVRNLLQERIQALYHITPQYRTTPLGDSEANRVYRVEVTVNDSVLGVGEAASKQVAAREAAQDALQRWDREGLPAAITALQPSVVQAEGTSRKKRKEGK